MKYIKEHKSKDVAQALSLDKHQVDRITIAIQKAYDQNWHPNGPNIDQINAEVAPHILTSEEGFYAAYVIFSDVFGAIMVPKMNQ